jgi:hypothetical protein
MTWIDSDAYGVGYLHSLVVGHSGLISDYTPLATGRLISLKSICPEASWKWLPLFLMSVSPEEAN